MARRFTHTPDKEPIETPSPGEHAGDDMIADGVDSSGEDEIAVEGTLYAHFYKVQSENVST